MVIQLKKKIHRVIIFFFIMPHDYTYSIFTVLNLWPPNRNGRKLFKIKTLSSYVNILNLFLSIVFVRLSCVQPHEIITTQPLYAGKGSYFRVINLFQQHNTECRLRRYSSKFTLLFQTLIISRKKHTYNSLVLLSAYMDYNI